LHGSAERFRARTCHRKPMTEHDSRKLLFSHLAGKVTVTSLYLGFTEAIFRDVATHVRCTGQPEHRRDELFWRDDLTVVGAEYRPRNNYDCARPGLVRRSIRPHDGIVAPLWSPVHAHVFDVGVSGGDGRTPQSMQDASSLVLVDSGAPFFRNGTSPSLGQCCKWARADRSECGTPSFLPGKGVARMSLPDEILING